MAIFNESSVNTVRCMTFCTSEGIVVPYCFMRVGRSGSFVDNGGAGGIIIGVNPHTGVVDTDGFDEYNNHYFLHPDSGITFKGFKIPDWERMLNICKSAALKITEMGFLSWDMAHTDDGWSVIEVNGVGQLIGPQIVYRRGIKKEIEQYLASMKKMI
jgi:glutathione synthase/RimK-type ligase-like ATP-grasp enzyme